MDNPYAAPQSEIATAANAPTPLTWKQILFSFEGRIPRRIYWGFSILLTLFNLSLGFVCGAIFRQEGVLTATIASIPTYWCMFALATKRWHDRDKSARWNAFQAVLVLNTLVVAFSGIANPLLAVAAGISALWILIELGCLRGTVGPNQYGEDPT